VQWDLWRSELEGMSIDAAADAPLLEALCVSYATAVKAHQKLAQLGEVVEEPIVDASGKIVGHRLKRNPWLGIRERAHRMLQSLSSDFGLSPAARTRLSVTPSADSYADIKELLEGPSLTDEEKKKLQ
jgi:P27 family predicted phage terminase small subunit